MMNTPVSKTLAALQELYRDLSQLENELREAGERLDGVQLEKMAVWADMQARSTIAGPAEQLFYKIQNALTVEALNALAPEVASANCSRGELAELMAEYQVRAEWFAAQHRALENN